MIDSQQGTGEIVSENNSDGLVSSQDVISILKHSGASGEFKIPRECADAILQLSETLPGPENVQDTFQGGRDSAFACLQMVLDMAVEVGLNRV